MSAGAIAGEEIRALAAPDPGTFLRGLLARHRKLRFEPGSQARYSNLGPLVLAAALTSVAGQPFTDLIAAEILRPPL